MNVLNLSADQALFENKVSGAVALCYENERPLQGLAGTLDWRLRGLFSSYIKKGVITGKAGECTYIPVSHRQEKILHLILIGSGRTEAPGKRGSLPRETLDTLKKNLKRVGIRNLALSFSDFEQKQEFFETQFKGVPICLVQ